MATAEVKDPVYRAPTFEELEKIGDAATSPDDFLRRIKEKGWILPYRVEVLQSGSKQEASLSSPREIRFMTVGDEMTSEEAIMITYNNESAQRGNGAIEIMATGERFRMKEYLCVKGKCHTDSKSCLQCHGSDPTGRWQVWDSWTTVLCGGNKGDTCEKDFARIRKTGRYAILPDALDLYKEMPANKMLANATPANQVVLLNSIMARSNARRIARKISQTMQEKPELAAFRYALIGISLCAPSTAAVLKVGKQNSTALQAWISPEALATFTKIGFSSFETIYAETAQLHTENQTQKLKYSSRVASLDTSRVAALRYIFSLQKRDIQDWNMEGLQYAHGETAGDLSKYWKSLAGKILNRTEVDQDLARKIEQARPPATELCQQLSQMSLKAVDEFANKKGTQAETCVTCSWK